MRALWAMQNLVVDNRPIVGALADGISSNHNVLASNTAIIRLSVGQSVWLECGRADGEIDSSTSDKFVSFSGVFLY